MMTWTSSGNLPRDTCAFGSLAGQNGQYPNGRLKTLRNHSRYTIMPPLAENLAGTGIATIAAHVSTLKP
ncbi:MAG: hypothetical protein EPN38_05155 [Rhodanobacteraceae bacterium]|nr:MAG: hypothetical protein EPN38_05155 [Rhodanobacteraceae bacterium]